MKHHYSRYRQQFINQCHILIINYNLPEPAVQILMACLVVIKTIKHFSLLYFSLLF